MNEAEGVKEAMTESAPIGQIRELARRAVEAWKVDGPMYVSPAEYHILRNVETETWNMSVVQECEELRFRPSWLESIGCRRERWGSNGTS